METILVLYYTIKVFLLWILADFITGMVHWWQDTYGRPNWPILGKYLVEPNLRHHANPRGMLKDSYWQQIRASFVAGVLLWSLLWFVVGWHSWQMTLCLLFSTQGNYIHALSHRTKKENGKLVTLLQKVGLFQSRKMHGWHHKAPYDTNFFIMTDYLNPIFVKIKFFERLERAIKKMFGISPARGTLARNGV